MYNIPDFIRDRTKCTGRISISTPSHPVLSQSILLYQDGERCSMSERTLSYSHDQPMPHTYFFFVFFRL